MARFAWMPVLLALALSLAAPVASAVEVGGPAPLAKTYAVDVVCVDPGPPTHAQVLAECASFGVWVSPAGVGVFGCVPLGPIRPKTCAKFQTNLLD